LAPKIAGWKPITPGPGKATISSRGMNPSRIGSFIDAVRTVR
jgi:hypothetical protein